MDLKKHEQILATEGLRAQPRVYSLRNDLRLAEHKIDQHLQGQYNYLPYPALGVALFAIRRALLAVEPVVQPRRSWVDCSHKNADGSEVCPDCDYMEPR